MQTCGPALTWPSNYQPDWLFQSMTHFSNLAYLRKKWPFLVLDNWKVVTNFLVKAVTQVLLFSGVTAFNSLSADFKSMLMPRSEHGPIVQDSNLGWQLWFDSGQAIGFFSDIQLWHLVALIHRDQQYLFAQWDMVLWKLFFKCCVFYFKGNIFD